MGYFLSFLVALIVSALVIFIVGRLNLGLTVSGYGAAMIGALVIAIVGTVVWWLLGLIGVAAGSGVIGTLVYIVVAAIVLMVSDRFISGLKVKGFTGAIVAAIAIGVVAYIVTRVLGLIGIQV